MHFPVIESNVPFGYPARMAELADGQARAFNTSFQATPLTSQAAKVAAAAVVTGAATASMAMAHIRRNDVIGSLPLDCLHDVTLHGRCEP
jgi:hypothetical protein